MASLLQQLDQAGFETAGLNEADLLSKLENAGFDTSPFQDTRTGLEKASDVSEKVLDIATKPIQPIVRGGMGLLEKSEEASKRLAEEGRLGAASVAAIPGVLKETVATPFRLAEAGGEKVAEFLGEKGFPMTGATIGTLTSLAPDIALGAGGAAKRAIIARGLQKGGQVAQKAAKVAATPVTAPVKSAAQTIKTLRGPGLEAAEEIGKKGMETARVTRDAAKKALIEAEEKAGIAFKEVPENFQKFISNRQVKIGKQTIQEPLVDFGNKANRLADKGVDFLADTMDVKTLQTFRKIAQEGLKKSGRLNDITRSQLSKTRDVFAKAIAKKEPGVGKALTEFRLAQEATKVATSRAKDLMKQAKNREALIKSLKQKAGIATGGLLGFEALRRLLAQ